MKTKEITQPRLAEADTSGKFNDTIQQNIERQSERMHNPDAKQRAAKDAWVANAAKALTRKKPKMRGMAEAANKPVDMTGKTCVKCKKDRYKERSQHDDMEGKVTCSCGHRVDRWKKKNVAEGFGLDSNTRAKMISDLEDYWNDVQERNPDEPMDIPAAIHYYHTLSDDDLKYEYNKKIGRKKGMTETSKEKATRYLSAVVQKQVDALGGTPANMYDKIEKTFGAKGKQRKAGVKRAIDRIIKTSDTD